MMKNALGEVLVSVSLAILGAATGFPPRIGAQVQRPMPPRSAPPDSAGMAGMTDEAMDMPADENMMKHMRLTPPRAATHADTVRAMKLADDLRQAIAKYQDTSAAVADGYRMFAPNIKNQRVYHFTNYGRAFMAAFHFDATKPTSILYKRGDDGRLHLVGAMYTMPKRASLDRLDERVPLGIARWHEHVNWCVPRKGEEARFTEHRNGAPVFGPESPIATKAECDTVGGRFFENLGGWMVHANVYEGHDLATVWSDDHRGGGHGHHM
ncbi:MAG TPA: hypothetical protein VL524_19170 [Gemmatimonadaceae bacterium]|jgi:hypothetical protein|nr:hypothetical protein [Gemmatimonadaceae bacterium]